MEWITHPGNADAQAVIAQYPTPRALRKAMQDEGAHVIPDAVRTLPWTRDTTIGDVLASVAFRPRDVARLHALLTDYARETEVWTAPDGAMTTRDAQEPAPREHRRTFHAAQSPDHPYGPPASLWPTPYRQSRDEGAVGCPVDHGAREA